MNKTGNKSRRVYLINPRFQVSFITWMVGISLVLNSIFYASNLVFIRHYIEKGQILGLPQGHPFFTFITDQYSKMNSIFLVTSLIAILATTIIGLVLSHRVAGPLHRLRTHLDSIAQGAPPSEIHFRTHDYFKELETSYNSHLKAFNRNPK